VTKTIVIQGKGSIGLRHALNLKELGYRVLFLRRINNNNSFNSSYNFEETFSFTESLNFNPIGAIICTPSSLHPQDAMKFLQNGIPVYIEKPLGFKISKYRLSKLKHFNKNKIIHGGYHLRYSDEINKFFNEIKKQKILKIDFVWKTNAKKWHPWENYNNSYSINYNLGGGVIHTCSHEIDLCLSLFHNLKTNGLKYKLDNKNKVVSKISANFLSDETKIGIELDYFSLDKQRKIYVKTINRDYIFDFDNHPNLQEDAYKKSLKDFLTAIKYGKNTVSNFENSLKTYKICEILLNET
jgi:predicted dehydrogenase